MSLKGRHIILSAAEWGAQALDDMVSPLIAQMGGNILRLSPKAIPGTMDYSSGYCLPHEELFRGKDIAAAIVQDSFHSEYIPKNVPIISLPHATWTYSHTLELGAKYRQYIKSTHYYLTQDDCTAHHGAEELSGTIETTIDTDTVNLVPLGSLKVDVIYSEDIKTKCKDCILICETFHKDVNYSAAVVALIRFILKMYKDVFVVYRPFPQSRLSDVSLFVRDLFLKNERFIYDESISSSLFMARSQTVIAVGGTSGTVFSIATGRPSIRFALGVTNGPEINEFGFTAGRPEDVLALIDAIISKDAVLRRFKRSIEEYSQRYIYKKGLSKELFMSYLEDIINGSPIKNTVSLPAAKRN